MKNFIFDLNNAIKSVSSSQHLIFSGACRGDLESVLALQKEFANTEDLRFVSIRSVLKLSRKNKLVGIDGKVSLNFKERFDLIHLLEEKLLDWNLQAFKEVCFVDHSNKTISSKVFTIADRCWQTAIWLIISPAQQAFFHPRSIGFREGYSIMDVSKIFHLNMNKEAGGLKKRVMIIELNSSFPIYNRNYLLDKIIAFKELKTCLSRALTSGLIPEFIDESLNLSSLLANVLLTGIENIHPGVRFGNNIAYFLNPSDSEGKILKKVMEFLNTAGIHLDAINCRLTSLSEGVDFCGWNFRLSLNGMLKSGPSFKEYQLFTNRIKNIINNSNYGVV